jgi:hypothetical protein
MDPEGVRMTEEEQKSLTHGEFWIPADERVVYREALELLNEAGVRYVVSGLYALHHYTGVYRKTKDLDLLLEPDLVVPAAETLKRAGYRVELREDHWLAKAFKGAQVDLIFGMANGQELIDPEWYARSRAAILAAVPVRVAPPEELIWHRLFIGERHRFDMADVAHLILHRGSELDWERLLRRVGPDWRLLLSQLHFFDYAYPDHRARVPDAVRVELRQREADAAGDVPAAPGTAPRCRGTLLSRYSFAIDVNEWGFQDERLQRVSRMRSREPVARIRSAEVWNG